MNPNLRSLALHSSKSRTLLVGLFAALLLAITALSTRAANPAPAQIYFLSLPADDTLDILEAVYSGAVSPVTSYTSIAVGVDGTIIYYDQWENGYVVDIANPTVGETYANPGNLGGVQIWGDGILTNGAAPGYADDLLDAGEVIVLTGSIPIPRNTSDIRFDGGDRFGATRTVAVVRSAWAEDADTLLSFAHEDYPTNQWGTAYTAPVGCNTANDGDMFEYAALAIMAEEDGTPVEIDADANGSYETSITLDQGESFLEEGNGGSPCIYVRQGAKVRSTDPTKPLQVQLFLGDIDDNYELRDVTLVPDANLSSEYYNPVGYTGIDDGGTDSGSAVVWLYNPNASTIFVRCQRGNGGGNQDRTISAGAVATVEVGNLAAANCYATTDNTFATKDPTKKFSGIVTMDTADFGGGDPSARIWDWSATLLPLEKLSNLTLVGLGLGRDPSSGTNPNENGNPIWVTPVCDTFFYVDWDNDGTPDLVDLDGDGDSTGTVDGVSESTSNNGMSVSRLKSVRLFKPGTGPRDQNGARIYTRVTTGNTGAGGCNFAAAWGEDPRWASVAAPGLDVGTTVLPVIPFEVSKNYELLDDADGNGAPSPGDTIRYEIAITNIGLNTFNNVKVFDEIPDFTTYVANSTDKDTSGDGTGPWTPIPDDGGGTAFPLDVTGGVVLGNLDSLDFFLVRFDVTLNAITSPANDYDAVSNCAVGIIGDSELEACADTVIDNMGQIGDTIWEDTDGDGVQDHGEPGIPGIIVELDPPPGVDLGNGPGNPITVTTDANGEYLFAGLPAGSYTVTVTNPPAGYTNTGDPDGGNNSTAGVTLGTNESNLNQDFGYQPVQTVSLSGNVFNDTNGLGDNTVNGVGIGSPGGTQLYANLVDTNGNVVAVVPVNANGTYSFSNVAVNTTYTVVLSTTQGTVGNPAPAAGLPSGWINTGENLGAGAGNDGTVNGVLSVPVATTNVTNANFGIQQTGSIGDKIWRDDDGDGNQDPGEPGIPGVTVTLDPPAGVDLGAGPGNPVNDVTDANGNYLFSNVPAGSYTVTVTPPPGTTNTGDPDGGNDSTSAVTLTAGQNNLLQDFGYQANPVNLSGNVFNDANGLNDNTVNGVGIGSPDGTQLYANLVGPNGNVVAVVPVNANGTYSFSNVAAHTTYTVVLSTTQGTVGQPAPAAGLPSGWINTGENLGAGAGNDGNPNGVLSVPVAAVDVTNANFGIQETSQIGDKIWQDMDGDGVQDPGEPGIPGITVTLDPPAGVDLGNGPGNPVTDVTDANGNYLFSDLPPGNYTVTVTPPPGTTNTGDPDGGFDSTSAVTLTAGQSNLLQDFGYQPTGQIGDTIWQDNDGDGVQDPGEPGIPGVTVSLDPPAGVDLGAGPGNPVTDTTDANGNYLFSNLPAGAYTVTVTPPPGTTNTGDPDGGNDSTAAVSLTDGEVDLTQDFGYQPSLQIGDKIWQDNDGDGVQDPGEPGIPGITVTLDPPAGVDLGNGPGNPVTDVTDANGEYLFSNLPPGSYTVTVTPPVGFTNTGDPDGGFDSTAAVTLTTQSNLNQDFGYQPIPIVISGNVYHDVNGLSDNTVNGLGIGTPAGVQLYANLVGPGGNVVAVVPVNANGSYLFTNVTANTTYTVVLSTTQGTVGQPPPAASLPPGWVNTGENLGAGPGNDGVVNGVLTVPVATSNVSNANFGIKALNVCPVGFSTNNWTDILGIGMGNMTKHKNIAKVSVPNYANVTSLYGQMAAKDVGLAKFVRFMYPNSTYEEVVGVTSPSSQVYGVEWWGSDLDPASNIRGRWFLQKTGTKNHIPRALILFPTYTDQTRQWVNVFETFEAADTQVYWETAGGWTPTQVIELDITPPQATTTFNVEIAMVENDADTRPVEVTVSAGGVTVMQAPVGPNKGDLLNIMTFTLANVPAGTDTITITIHSPSPNEQLFYGGDSAAITGVTANYQCVAPTIP